MIVNRNIIYISNIEWNFLWQTHQEIVLRLAAAGNRVLYIENTGVRTPGLRDWSRVWSRLKRWAGALGTQGVRQVAPNIYVCAPFVLPPFGSPLRKAINRRVLLPRLVQTARDLEMHDALLWTYMPTDTAVDLIEMLGGRERTVVYYCVAEFSLLTPHAEQMEQSEKELVELSDLVFAMCAELAERIKLWKPDVHVFQGGVNLEAFPLVAEEVTDAALSDDDRDESSDRKQASWLATLPQPIIGYVGGLHHLVDYEMLTASARARPRWSWVFVGSVQTSVGEFAALPNVHLLGERPHAELANYIRGFNVCIVPYVVNKYTRTVVPTKINEYLAMGKPVVSTDLPTVCNFNGTHQVLSTCHARADDFLQAIERELHAPNDWQTIAGRREVATLADWQGHLEQMSQLIENCEAEKHALRKQDALN